MQEAGCKTLRWLWTGRVLWQGLPEGGVDDTQVCLQKEEAEDASSECQTSLRDHLNKSLFKRAYKASQLAIDDCHTGHDPLLYVEFQAMSRIH